MNIVTPAQAWIEEDFVPKPSKIGFVEKFNNDLSEP